jgi:diadenosine tetraphosphate (Ap4A) HIT family hydrolase
VAENNLALAFLTNTPIVEGHTLVIPKRCTAKYESLTVEEKSAIEDLRKLFIKNLKEKFGAEGFNFAWNDGETAGQSVLHFHLHVLPRKRGDSGIYKYEPRKFLYQTIANRETTPEKGLQKLAQKFKIN